MNNFKDWKTTAPAIISAAGSFILFAPSVSPSIHFPEIVRALAAFASAGGLAALGISATSQTKKD